MPIVRVDVPEWLSHAQRTDIRAALHGCVARTWFREHIWIAVRPITTEPDERMVIMTVEVREGRGHEKERTQALFDEAHEVFERIVGTPPEEFILLVRMFGQDNCISGGAALPPLADATPDISELRTRSKVT